MNRIIGVLLLGITLASVLVPRPSLANDPTSSSDTSAAAGNACIAASGCKPLSHKVVAYYFHGDARCAGCRRIEAWSAESIKEKFQKELESGQLEWKVVNVDKSENEHFNDDYQLYTKSLVIVDFRDGTQVKWKILEGVWQLLSDQEAFSKYVSAELAGYLKEG